MNSIRKAIIFVLFYSLQFASSQAHAQTTGNPLASNGAALDALAQSLCAQKGCDTNGANEIESSGGGSGGVLQQRPSQGWGTANKGLVQRRGASAQDQRPSQGWGH